MVDSKMKSFIIDSIDFSKMKAPGDLRPTWMGGIIQIHITRVCNLSCVSCTQGSNLGGKPVIMSLINFEKAVKTLKNYFGVVGIFGGNPCMHPEFTTICDILMDNIPKERRGLWSNNLMGHGKVCREVFNPNVSNLNVHMDRDAYNEMIKTWPECNPIGLMADSRHSPPFVAMDDIEGLNENDKVRLINNCDINQLWSAMICQINDKPYAYFCELAGAQAMLHNDPVTGLDLSYSNQHNSDYREWWKLPINKFNSQIIRHCFSCGVPLRGKGDLAVTGQHEYVSSTHLPIYRLKDKNKTLHIVTKLDQLGGSVRRTTDYISNGVIK